MELKGLRLAVLAAISWPAPPPGYGPWEQIAFNVADGMRRRGLDVTLFATGNSRFDGKLVSVVPVGLNEDPALNGEVFTALHIGELFRRAHEFDLINNHFDWKPLTYALASDAPPLVTTIHGFSSPQILAAYYAAAQRSFYCSISNADRDPGLDYLATTYNGIDPAAVHVQRSSRRVSLLSRALPSREGDASRDRDRKARRRAPQDRRDSAGRNVLSTSRLRRISTAIASSFWARSSARLVTSCFPTRSRSSHMTTRPERFGLTTIEAMACGTPVLGARMGSIPEIVVDGVTGFLCDGVDDAVAKVPLLASLDRRACRTHVEREFSVERMIDRYLDAYAQALDAATPPPPSDEKLRVRRHDWWDRPMAYTEIPPKPKNLGFS